MYVRISNVAPAFPSSTICIIGTNNLPLGTMDKIGTKRNYYCCCFCLVVLFVCLFVFRDMLLGFSIGGGGEILVSHMWA